MALTSTTIDTLHPLFVTTIRETTPRITYKGAEAWKPYDSEAASANRSRRFRLVWEEGNFVKGGIWTNSSVECEARLRVRVDYAGEHEKLQLVRQNDLHQLRDRLQTLTANAANGLILVQAVRVDRPVRWDRADVAQFDLVYQVRYLLARG